MDLGFCDTRPHVLRNAEREQVESLRLLRRRQCLTEALGCPVWTIQNPQSRGFPGSPVVKTLISQGKRRGFHPWSVN